MSEKTIIYYPEAGEGNTEKTLKAAKKRGDELGIKNIVVSSTSARADERRNCPRDKG
jgi:hypothetical protein